MSDLISRQAAIEALKRDEEYNEDIPERADGVRDAIITISGLPSAQPERKTGWWMTIERGENGYSAGDFKCSVCGKPNKCYTLTKFCPNCGAKMEVEHG